VYEHVLQQTGGFALSDCTVRTEAPGSVVDANAEDDGMAERIAALDEEGMAALLLSTIYYQVG
jgi:hypothetical protein